MTATLALAGALSGADHVLAGVATGPSDGTEHWLAFWPHLEMAGTPRLQILAGQAATGTVEIEGIGFSQAFQVSAASIVEITLPSGVLIDSSESVLERAVRVTSNRPVVVYGLALAPGSNDSFLVLPAHQLGQEHLVLAHAPAATAESVLALVATVDGTTATITPTVPMGSHPAGVPFQITLDRGDVYRLSSAADPSGTLVQGDHAIAVFAGATCAAVPAGSFYCDLLAEQQLPVELLGDHYVLVPFATRAAGDRVRVLGTANGTTLTGSAGCTSLDRGQFCEFVLTAVGEIAATAPVAVAQYAQSSAVDSVENADPSFVNLWPTATGSATRYRVATADDGAGFPTTYLGLAVPSAGLGLVEVDGAAVPAGSYTATPAGDHHAARVVISPGAHDVTSPVPIGLVVYGYGPSTSYAHAGAAVSGAEVLFGDDFETGSPRVESGPALQTAPPSSGSDRRRPLH